MRTINIPAGGSVATSLQYALAFMQSYNLISVKFSLNGIEMQVYSHDSLRSACERYDSLMKKERESVVMDEILEELRSLNSRLDRLELTWTDNSYFSRQRGIT